MIISTNDRRREQLDYAGPNRRFSAALSDHIDATHVLTKRANENAREALKSFIVGTVLMVLVFAALLIDEKEIRWPDERGKVEVAKAVE